MLPFLHTQQRRKHQEVHCSLRGDGKGTEKTHITGGDQIRSEMTKRSFSSTRPADSSAHRGRRLWCTSTCTQLWYQVLKNVLRIHICNCVICVKHDTSKGTLLLGYFWTHTPDSLTQLGAISTTNEPEVHVPGSWRTQRNQENMGTAQHWPAGSKSAPALRYSNLLHIII